MSALSARVGLGPLALMVSCAAMGTAWLAGCSQQPNVVPSRNLDRPTDMVMGCMGLVTDDQTMTQRVSGRPMKDCHPPRAADPPPSPEVRTFGFVANTARGELSVIDLDRSRPPALVDLDPGVTGFNTAPLGLLPEAMDISGDGCRVVTANRGSCDLSVVDPGELMSPTLAAEAKADLSSNASAAVATVKVKTAAGTPLNVAPYEIQFLPRNLFRAASDPPRWCPAGGAGTGSWQALVTFPSCDLVALIDLPSGTIIDSTFVRAAAGGQAVELEAGGANPSCPFVDCGAGPRRMPPPPVDGSVDAIADAGVEAVPLEGGAEAPLDPDGGGAAGDGADALSLDGAMAPDGASAADGGPAPLPPVRVIDQPYIGPGPLGVAPLAIHPDGKRAYVGLSNASFVASIAIGDRKLSTPANGGSIYLHEGALGSNRIRLSVDPYNVFRDDKDNSELLYGQFVGDTRDGFRRFLYVIARDGTVRVIHVSDNAPQMECDTNVDPRLLLTTEERSTPCFEVNPQRRKVLAVGPGIPVPELPRDVAFVDLTTADTDERVVDGAYAFVLTATGTIYIVNIAPTPRTTLGVKGGVPQSAIPEPMPLLHTLRDGNVMSYSRQLTAAAGPARVDVFPVAPPIGPRLEGYFTMDTEQNATALGAEVLTYVFFPDRSAVAGQTWSIAWEGALFPEPRFSGKVVGELRTPAGQPALEAVLRDRGGGFCRLGVQAGDVVTLEGCVDNSQCGVGQVCVASTAGSRTAAGGLPIKGLCLSPEPVKQEQERALCQGLQESIRRYEVVRAHPTELVIRPRVDELVKPSLNRCDDDMDCRPVNDPTHAEFVCQDRRCVRTCLEDKDCRAGRKCVNFERDPNATPKRLCADGPEIIADCFPQLTTYRVHAGRSFLVRGSVSVPPSTTLTVPDPAPGRFNYPSPDPLICVEDPERNPVLATRLSIDSPACKNVMNNGLDGRARADNREMLQRTDTTPDPNPCVFIGGPTQGDPLPDPDPANPPKHTRALFQNPELRFVLSNLEQPFPDNMDIRFEVHGGFRPQSVLIPPETIDVGMPARLLVSPIPAIVANQEKELPYLFVVDQRRLGRTRGSTPTRGQVLRIHPQVPLQRQPIYQDFNTSGGLFPIQ